MDVPSPLLQLLLETLTAARHGTTLVLDAATIGNSSAAALLTLFSRNLGISAFTIDDVVLPSAVEGDTFAVSGGAGDVTTSITFADAGGEVAVRALFQATTLAPLTSAFGGLGQTFFDGIIVEQETTRVPVPGLPAVLNFAAPLYGVVGFVIPSSGIVSTSVSPRVDGEVAAPSGAKSLFVEVGSETSGFEIAPLVSGWAFSDFAWLMPGLSILEVFPDIIPTAGLGLQTFSLSLLPHARKLSRLMLDVADIADPSKPLWTAVGGKVALTDVAISLDLDYSETSQLLLVGSGFVQGRFVLDSLVLTAQIPFPLTGVWAVTAYPNASLTVLDDLATLIGGPDHLDSILPAELSKLGSFELTFLRIAVDAKTMSLVEFAFSVGSDETWTIVPDVIALQSLSIRLRIDGTPSCTGMVSGIIALPQGAHVLVTFGRVIASSPWTLSVVSPAISLPRLGDLAQLAQGEDLGALVEAGGLDKLHFVMTDLQLVLTLAPSKLTYLELTLQLANADDPLDPKLDWELIPGVLTLTRFSFGFRLVWGQTATKEAFGSFVINGLEFRVGFARASDQIRKTNALYATYSAEGAPQNINVKALVDVISPSVARHLPDDLDIDIAYGLLVYLGDGETKKYLFAIDIDIELPISDLPLVGKALPADAKVAVKNLKVVVASAAFTVEDLAYIGTLLPTPLVPTAPPGTVGDAIPAGFSMMGELHIGALSILLTSPPAKKASQEIGRSVVVARSNGAASLGSASDAVMWINVQKTFGPVSIQKIGFTYQNGSLFVLSNIALAVSGLELDLLGIGIGSPIKHPAPRFTIEGIAASFQEGPVSIMGGMIGTLEPLDFVGALSVRVPEFSLAAFAGYATYQDHPSFFLYGVLDAPLGGVPAFFVTGVAAGLGFNRKLVIPDVSGVATFPLVAWAQGTGTPSMDPAKPIGGQVADVLSMLAQSGVVAPSVGNYWFAAGLAFTSFELITSFALLTVSLGTDTEIALIGTSTLTIPPMDPAPVAEVQIALEAAFSFDKGLLSVAGQLTPNSFILARACRPTGGFAFYLWFTGEHSGETVLTLGGYNPTFSVPNDYPRVPRLGLDWQVDGSLSITGGLYFALTSNVVMAGGKLSAVWNSGSIRAWFTYWADFLMTFAPFHYYVSGGIDLGASFTVDFKLFSTTMSVHVGIGLEIWGPEFAGVARVDLSVISFTIRFGPQSRDADTSIPWDEFVRALLPSGKAAPSLAGRRARRPVRRTARTDAPAVVQITVIGGMVRELPATPEGSCYLVSAETFSCAVLTVIPSKQAELGANPDRPSLANVAWAPAALQPKSRDGTPIVPNTAFGAGPAALAPAVFQPKLSVSIATEADGDFYAIRRFANAPKALWENKRFTSHGVPQDDPATALSQSTIPNAFVGITLVPHTSSPDKLLPIPIASLLYAPTGIQPFAWSPGEMPMTNPFTNQTVADTIVCPTIVGVRAMLVAALAGLDVIVNGDIDVSGLANPANDDIEAAPRLRLLGSPIAPSAARGRRA